MAATTRSQSRRDFFLAAVLAWAVIITMQLPGFGQLSDPPPQNLVTRELIESRSKEAEESQDLADDTKAKVRELYQQALKDLDVAANLAAQATAFDEMARSFPARFQQTKAKLSEQTPGMVVDVPKDASLTDLEQIQKQHEVELAKLKQEAARLDAEQTRRQTRRTEIPASIALIRERLANIEKQQATPPPADEPALSTNARQLRTLVQRQMLEQELIAGEKELAAYAAETTEFLNAQRDLAARLAGQADARVVKLREMANRRRQEEAERLANAVRLEAARAHPLLQPEADRNTTLAEQSETLAPKIRSSSLELERTSQALERVKSEYQTIQQKVDRAGLTEGIGLLLRRQLSTLPDSRQYLRRLQARRSEMRDAELTLIDLDDERYGLSDTDRKTEQLLADLQPPPANVEREDLQRALRELLETRKELLDKLIQSQGGHFELLVQLDSAENELIKEVDAYSDYLRERVLWIRSAPLFPGDMSQAGHALAWLFSPENWRDVVWAAIPYGQKVQSMRRDETPHSWSAIGSAVSKEVGRRSQPLISTFLFLIFFVVLASNQRRLREQLREYGQQAARRNCQRFSPTSHSLLETVFISLLWPSLLLSTLR